METTRQEGDNNFGSDNQDINNRFQTSLQAMRVQQQSQIQLFESRCIFLKIFNDKDSLLLQSQQK